MALDQAVRLKQKHAALVLESHHRAVVARGGDHVRGHRQIGQEAAQQSVLAQLPQVHGAKVSGKASATRVKELKSACMVIETRIEPLHS